MTSSGTRRRDVLIAVSGCVSLAGCGDDAADARTGYGASYGRGYGGE
ncbi:hypothetical protein [Natrinema versiforme]|nr:hypothetical protein [Natrinema versiforme]